MQTKIGVEYYADTDSLFMELKAGKECRAAEVAPGIVFHYTVDGAVTATDIDSQASKLVDVRRLNVEGLPVEVRAAPGGLATSRSG